MTPLQKLNHYATAEKYKHSTLPEYARIKCNYSDRTANGLTKCVIKCIELCGGQAERISSEGRVIDTRKTYTDVIGRQKTIGSIKRVYSSTTNGTADVSALFRGFSLKIEIKIGKDKQSEAQKQYERAVNKAGGLYIIVRDFQGFYDWLHSKFEKE